MKESILKTKSFEFALNAVQQFQSLQNNREFILSKQFVRSSTSIGANVREANNAESLKDFIHKLHISQKECDETIYWLELLFASNYINQNEFEKLNKQANELLKILKSSIYTSKLKLKSTNS